MRCFSIWLLTAMAVFMAHGQTSRTNTVQVNSQAPTYLYGGKASKLEGDVKKRGGDNFGWKGNGDVTWEVQVDKVGEYAVGLCHAAEPDAVGQQLQISGGQSRLSYALAMTQGVFGNKSYALAPIQGSLHLAAGQQTITLSITNTTAGRPLLAFRSLELTPLSAKAAIDAERPEAQRSGAGSD